MQPVLCFIFRILGPCIHILYWCSLYINNNRKTDSVIDGYIGIISELGVLLLLLWDFCTVCTKNPKSSTLFPRLMYVWAWLFLLWLERYVEWNYSVYISDFNDENIWIIQKHLCSIQALRRSLFTTIRLETKEGMYYLISCKIESWQRVFAFFDPEFLKNSQYLIAACTPDTSMSCNYQ